MRIATWNVNGLRARLDFLRCWLRERQPDVVALQELKLEDEHFPHAELEAEGYRALVYGQKGWNGVAILSRGEAELVQRGLPGQEEMGSRLLSARVEGLTFASLYVPNGKHLGHEDFGRKLAWLDALAGHLEASHRPEEPLLLGGDFNVCPTALDSWGGEKADGEIFHTEDERARMRRLAGWGLFDLYREREPEGKAFSWWDYRGGAFYKNQGLRIDFLLGTAPVLARVGGVTIDREYRKKKDELTASDHAPVWAEVITPKA